MVFPYPFAFSVEGRRVTFHSTLLGQKIAKLVNITTITVGFVVVITTVYLEELYTAKHN